MSGLRPCLALMLLACACSPGGGGGRRGDGGAGDGRVPGREGDRSTCLDGIDEDGDGLIDCMDPDCLWLTECGGAGDAGSRDAFEACTSDPYEAMTGAAPVDIIWIVDNSGSMRGEADQVQRNMTSFAMAFERVLIDFHVVVISADGFVTIPGTLGADPAKLRMIAEDVQSHDGLVKLISTFPRYMDFLRPGAITHFVVVSDDETTSMDPSEFRPMMEGLLGHPFTFHSIVSPPGSTHCEPSDSFCLMNVEGCSGPDDDAAANGDRYWSLSMMTGGQTLSICTEDWSGLFATLAAAIAVPMPLPCSFSLPPPPDGMELDFTKVNLVFTPSTGGEQTIPNVGDESRCGDGDGWYYDDPAAPSRILVCPTTCARFEADEGGHVDVALGCATVII